MVKSILTLSVLSLALVGCGGGGSNSSENNKPEEITPAAGAIDKFIGTWVRGCTADDEDIRQSSDDLTTNTTLQLAFTKLSATTANTELTITAYANSDKNCTGESIGSVVMTGLNTGAESYGKNGMTTSLGSNVLTFVDTVTLASGQKVDRITLKTARLASIQGIVGAGALKVDTTTLGNEDLKGLALIQGTNSLVLDLDDSYPSALTADFFTTYNKK
jgi:hypothetical protein